ncbi:MAG: hypothetical protein CR993_06930 [Rhodobacterales bacterium]|nr:MAG: hypothetical protein CR993_06930 [Rhodobacterales bacterium]
MNRFAAIIAAALIATPALADDVTDTLESALEAYQSGDIAGALDELDFAKSLLQELNADALTSFLPPAPKGWTREIVEGDGPGLALLGGGASAEAKYTRGDDTLTVQIMADNPLVTTMSGILSNASMLGLKVKRIGREKFMLNDGELTGLIDKRILVTASGGTIDEMAALLEGIDFKKLADFGN